MVADALLTLVEWGKHHKVHNPEAVGTEDNSLEEELPEGNAADRSDSMDRRSEAEADKDDDAVVRGSLGDQVARNTVDVLVREPVWQEEVVLLPFDPPSQQVALPQSQLSAQ